MNKTININLGGLIFHIDQDAFEILNKYLNALKNHFKNEEGGDEILKDIEGRIAELFTKKIEKKEIVSITDVNEVIRTMGNPSDYDEDFNNEEKTDYNKDLLKNKRRRFFRDEEERMIGGVCSGLAQSFEQNIFIIRMIFLGLLFIIGPGAPFLYIMFWIALPSAKTTSEKLEMKGEKVTVKNIKNEFENLEKKVKDFDKPFLNFIQKIIDLIVSLIKGIFQLIGSCFGVFAIITGVILLFIFFSAINLGGVMIAVSDFSWWLDINQLGQYIFESEAIPRDFKTGIILFIGIPILAVILFGLRLTNNTKIHTNYKIGMLCLWFVSLFFLFNSSVDVSKEFQEEAKNTIVENIIVENDTIYLSMKEVDRVFDNAFDAKGFKVTPFEDKLIGIGMRLDVLKSENDNFRLIKEATACGRSKQKARKNAEGVSFNFIFEDDNLIFDDFFYIEEQKLRFQELNLSLKIPEGSVIYLDHSMEDLIYDIKNTTDTWDYDMLGHYWKMEKEGLTCISCED